MKYEIFTFIQGSYAGQLNAANAFRLLYNSDALLEILRRYDSKARVSIQNSLPSLSGQKAFIYFFDRQLMIDVFSIRTDYGTIMENYIAIESQFSESFLSEGAKEDDTRFIRNVLAVVADIKDGFYYQFPTMVRENYNALQLKEKEKRKY